MTLAQAAQGDRSAARSTVISCPRTSTRTPRRRRQRSRDRASWAWRATRIRGGMPFSFVAGFAVEVDVETGHYALLDYLGVADVGTVSAQPRRTDSRSLDARHRARHRTEVGVDQHYGVTLARRFYENRPPTILDAPQHMQWDALNIPDPGTPVGSRGIGEPPVAAGCNAVLNALIDAVERTSFAGRRSRAT